MLKERASGERVWEFRCYELDSHGKRKRRTYSIGSESEYPTESHARKSSVVQSHLLRINGNQNPVGTVTPNFGAVIARYEQEEMPERHSTRISYQSYIENHIKPRWENVPLNGVKPMAVEDWLKGLALAPKTKSHICSLMHTIFSCAQRWELTERNPLDLVRVKGGTKREKDIHILTTEEFNTLMTHLREPYRTMVLVAGCLGLRVSEIMGLKWEDVDSSNSTVSIRRSVVHGRIGEVKTEYSKDTVPVDSQLAKALRDHKTRVSANSEGWIFANAATGKPYHQEQIQKTHIKDAATAAGIVQPVGWHTFRHSYRSWLDDTKAPVGVQKELMRHASIQTTMNVYGKAMSDTKRDANAKVVEQIFAKPLKNNQDQMPNAA